MRDYTYTLVGETNNAEHVIAQDILFQEAIELYIDYSPMYDKIHIIEEHDMIVRHKNLLVISDTHGMLKETKLMIADRPLELNEQIVFLGNFISKEEAFLPYMEYLIDLSAHRDCVFVLGRTEYNLMQYINQTHEYIGLKQDIVDLVSLIEHECGFSLIDLKQNMPDVFALFNSALPYYENDAYIFVSGGLDLESPSWRNTTPDRLHQTSPEFLMATNNTGKTIVFGSAPVKHLNTDEQNRPWISGSQNKIGINGDLQHFGKLIGLLIHEDDRYFVNIRHQETRNVAEAYIGNDHILFGVPVKR